MHKNIDINNLVILNESHSKLAHFVNNPNRYNLKKAHIIPNESKYLSVGHSPRRIFLNNDNLMDKISNRQMKKNSDNSNDHNGNYKGLIPNLNYPTDLDIFKSINDPLPFSITPMAIPNTTTTATTTNTTIATTPKPIQAATTPKSTLTAATKFYTLNLAKRNLENLDKAIVENSRYSNLYIVDISYNKLLEFPIEIINCRYLNTLKIDYNYLKKLPNQISELTSIKHLSISNNYLLSLPKTIGCLKALLTLNISYNHIDSLPKELFDLHKLEILYINNNYFYSIPSQLMNLSLLKEIAIEWFKYAYPSLDTIQYLNNPSSADNTTCNEGATTTTSMIPKLLELCKTHQANKKHEINFEEFIMYFSNIPAKFDLLGMKDSYSRNLLHEAILKEEIGIVKYILQYKTNLINELDSDNHTPLSLSINEQKYMPARILLCHSIVDVKLGGGSHGSPLHISITHFEYAITKDLLKNGANPNAQNKDGNTPLHILFSSFTKDIEKAKDLAKLLMDHGANPNIKNRSLWCPLHLAVKRGHIEGIKWIMEYNAKVKGQEGQGNDNDEDLVKRRFDMEMKGGVEGYNALHLALSLGRVEILGELFENNVDMMQRTGNGKTARDVCMSNLIMSKLIKKYEIAWLTKQFSRKDISDTKLRDISLSIINSNSISNNSNNSNTSHISNTKVKHEAKNLKIMTSFENKHEVKSPKAALCTTTAATAALASNQYKAGRINGLTTTNKAKQQHEGNNGKSLGIKEKIYESKRGRNIPITFSNNDLKSLSIRPNQQTSNNKNNNNSTQHTNKPISHHQVNLNESNTGGDCSEKFSIENFDEMNDCDRLEKEARIIPRSPNNIQKIQIAQNYRNYIMKQIDLTKHSNIHSHNFHNPNSSTSTTSPHFIKQDSRLANQKLSKNHGNGSSSSGGNGASNIIGESKPSLKFNNPRHICPSINEGSSLPRDGESSSRLGYNNISKTNQGNADKGMLDNTEFNAYIQNFEGYTEEIAKFQRLILSYDECLSERLKYLYYLNIFHMKINQLFSKLHSDMLPYEIFIINEYIQDELRRKNHTNNSNLNIMNNNNNKDIIPRSFLFIFESLDSTRSYTNSILKSQIAYIFGQIKFHSARHFLDQVIKARHDKHIVVYEAVLAMMNIESTLSLMENAASPRSTLPLSPKFPTNSSGIILRRGGLEERPPNTACMVIGPSSAKSAAGVKERREEEEIGIGGAGVGLSLDVASINRWDIAGFANSQGSCCSKQINALGKGSNGGCGSVGGNKPKKSITMMNNGKTGFSKGKSQLMINLDNVSNDINGLSSKLYLLNQHHNLMMINNTDENEPKEDNRAKEENIIEEDDLYVRRNTIKNLRFLSYDNKESISNDYILDEFEGENNKTNFNPYSSHDSRKMVPWDKYAKKQKCLLEKSYSRSILDESIAKNFDIKSIEMTSGVGNYFSSQRASHLYIALVLFLA